MLQQTTVRSVVPYFERFTARFPTLADLAAASDDEVLALWSGLGYYSRARNLLLGARHLLESHGGRFPSSLEDAMATPGVGRYTASAVLSLTLGLPLPVVDGNVRRVLSRLFALGGDSWSRDEPYYALAAELIDRDDPGLWNEALMELGATVCTPRHPSCPTCPLRATCQAKSLDAVSRYPEPSTKRKTLPVTVAAALVTGPGGLLLVRRPAGRLLSRLWELPQTALETEGPPDLSRQVAERYGLKIEVGPLLVEARHAVTFRRIRLLGFEARLTMPLAGDTRRFVYASLEDLTDLPASSMTRKLLLGLTKGQLPRKL
jgi:A/G-specific adenine glycosylase